MDAGPEFFNALIESLRAAYLFLVLITEDSPIGMWSAAGALIMPACAAPFVRKYMPRWQTHPQLRSFVIDMTLLASGVAVAYLPWPTLHGLLVGIVGGFASSSFWRFCGAVFPPLWRWVLKRLGVESTPPVRQDFNNE